MPQGLPRKLRYAFILQAVVASFAIVGGIYVAGLVVKQVLTDQRLHAEAERFWQARAVNPNIALPITSTVDSYFLPSGGDPAALPAPLRHLQPGIARRAISDRKVLVDRHQEGTLYIVMSFALVDKIIRWTSAASMSISLFTLYLASWLTYRTSKRLVTPINWLAREVSHWRPEDLHVAAIAPENMPLDSGSEVRQLGNALRGLAARVSDFVQRERDFTRDASHELRTPLTVIRVASDLMLNDIALSGRARTSLARIQRAGRDMEIIIDAFLILAREDYIAPQNESFDVREIVLHEVSKISLRLQEKEIKLNVVDGPSPRLNASPHAFAVVIGHLLSNACAFTEKGELEIKIEESQLSIRDSGIGMSAETLGKASNPFYRADQFNSSGKGMGLSIVRRLCQRFGWNLVLNSTVDVGTTATISFVPGLPAQAQ